MLNLTVSSSKGRAIEESAVRKFEARLVGRILRPGGDGYESARRVWTGMTDQRRPGFIVRCAATSDVVRAVDFARSNDIAIAVRAGGHSFAGDSFCEGGMVIDVSNMKAIRIDPERCVARAEAGLTVGEFDHATQRFKLATVLGECASVGIAGYTLGGGLGRLMGKHGVACDNLLSAEVVGADGSIMRTSADENADLFWGIRGGGGNFGIVTSLESRLHPVGQILGGTLIYPISAIRDVLSFLDGYMNEVPDEFDIVIDIGRGGVMTFAPRVMEPIVSLAVSYCGDLHKGEAALKPLRSFRQPLAETIRAISYLEMQDLSDIRPFAEFGSAGGLMALESGFIQRLGEEAIEIIVAFVREAPSCFWIAAEHYLHGAACRPAASDKAFALRQSGYSTRIFAGWTKSSEADGAFFGCCSVRQLSD